MTEERKPRLEELAGGFHRYLGDGVYAAFDGSFMTLRIGHHGAPVAVHIDDETWEALVKWRNDLIAAKKTQYEEWCDRWEGK